MISRFFRPVARISPIRPFSACAPSSSQLSHRDVVRAFESEAVTADHAIRTTHGLRRFFRPASDSSPSELRRSYLQLLKTTSDYVRHSVPMMIAAGEALR